MDAAQTIRDCIAKVNALREQRSHEAALAQAASDIKALQTRRFAGTYADLLVSPRMGPAARFFLQELYGAADFSERDAQFGRIAGPLQTLFPQPVVQTAVALAQLHAHTESLDHAMAQAWRAGAAAAPSPPQRYVRAWQAVGQRDARQQQLSDVLAMGRRMAQLTRTPGLRTLLRMMRGPAQAAGMSALQHFLETGFDVLGQLARERGAIDEFLATIASRENRFIALLFDADTVTCETELTRALGEAR